MYSHSYSLHTIYMVQSVSHEGGCLEVYCPKPTHRRTHLCDDYVSMESLVLLVLVMMCVYVGVVILRIGTCILALLHLHTVNIHDMYCLIWNVLHGCGIFFNCAAGYLRWSAEDSSLAQ